MVDPTTVNRGYAIPTRGSDPGTWDIPVNGDFALLDNNLGAVGTVAVSNTTITLTPAQLAFGVIRLTGTLTSAINIIFPTGVAGWWTIDDTVTYASTAFAINIGTPASTAFVCSIPGECFDISTDGTNIKYRNLGRIGSYLDLATASIPTWILNASPNPYLICIGQTFSGATYPILAQMLGGTTLPDARGRSRFMLGLATGRLTSAGAGIDGTTLLAAGGNNGVTLQPIQIPPLTSSGNNTITVSSAEGNILTGSVQTGFQSGTSGSGILTLGGGPASGIVASGGNNNIVVTFPNTGQTIVPSTIPGFVGGITMIRAG